MPKLHFKFTDWAEVTLTEEDAQIVSKALEEGSGITLEDVELLLGRGFYDNEIKILYLDEFVPVEENNGNATIEVHSDDMKETWATNELDYEGLRQSLLKTLSVSHRSITSSEIKKYIEQLRAFQDYLKLIN